MKDFFKSYKNRKLTLEQWAIIKYIVWFTLNIFFIVKNYILFDVFIINIFIIFGHFCTRIHSWGEGMYIGMTKMEESKKIEKIMMPTIFDKKDIN